MSFTHCLSLPQFTVSHSFDVFDVTVWMFQEVPPALHVPKATSAPKLVHRHVTSAHQEISLRLLPARGVKVVLMANTRRLLQLGIAQIVPQGRILHQI